jgi:hypothetical protein
VIAAVAGTAPPPSCWTRDAAIENQETGVPMSNRPPPVPPAGRSNKGPAGARPAEAHVKDDRTPPDNPAEQDRQGNVKQNTTNQGYQQDR